MIVKSQHLVIALFLCAFTQCGYGCPCTEPKITKRGNLLLIGSYIYNMDFILFFEIKPIEDASFDVRRDSSEGVTHILRMERDKGYSVITMTLTDPPDNVMKVFYDWLTDPNSESMSFNFTPL